VALCLIGITIVGLPVALLGLAAYLAALYLAKVFVASVIGQILRGPSVGGWGSFGFSLLAGLVVVFVAINLPYVGGLLGFLVALTGMGVAPTRTYRAWLLGVTGAGAGAPAQR
jgi:hypothetical protein